MFPSDTRILVVDDSTPIRQLISNVLSQLEFTNVVQCKDGDEAFELMKSHVDTDKSIQLVISDINMPNLDGISLIEKCQGDPDLKPVPFIMVTTENARETVLKAVMAGVKGYIMKPFSAADVAAQLKKAYKSTRI